MTMPDVRHSLCWRWIWPLIWLSLLSGSGAWVWFHYLSNPAFFPLRTVQIQGGFRYLEPAQIEQALETQLTDTGFFNLDLTRLQAACMALPWVAEAHVRRIWPDTVHIMLLEQVPLARWGETESVTWINARGELFRPTQAITLDLPVLIGATSQATELIDLLQQIQPTLPDPDLRLRRLQRHPPGNWTIQLQPGLTVLLDHRQPLQRWRDFVQIYPRLPKPARRIDLRYPQGFAVLFKDAA
ncbi:MAG: cell division protein FtsQ/DivIB [Pseudomonadota bacterium]